MSYTKKYAIDIEKNEQTIVRILTDLSKLTIEDRSKVEKLLQKTGFTKSGLLIAYKKLKKLKKISFNASDEAVLLKLLTLKNVRTLSGVTPVTVLTKPFPCPGKCVFCPNDLRMPKSYLSNEPGAQRAEANRFDPYYQTFNRLLAFRNTGHPTDKIELIILGGTWSSYPEFYQIWFVKRCFDAMNDFGKSTRKKMLTPPTSQPYDESILDNIKSEVSKKSYNQLVSKMLSTKLSKASNESSTWEELFTAHDINERSKSRCVGLVIETRPDEINEEEVIRIRKLGATKVQIGIQSLSDEVLSLNKRGHDVSQTKKAINLLRQAGFKIHAHWMPNLYGSTWQNDINDFDKLFSDLSIKPDELKVYPCSLIESAELMSIYKQGLWKPYSELELLNVLTHVLKTTPRYCRLTRIIRDIPSQDIVVGNKKTNFRQIAEQELKNAGEVSKDIRAREVKNANLSKADLTLKKTEYDTDVSKEIFIEYVTTEDEVAAFLRLSLPKTENFIDELKRSAIIREVHVYGQSVELGKTLVGKAQHIGLGKELIKYAEDLSAEQGFKNISVISSIGTREYYKKLGYKLENLYQKKATTLSK